MEQPFEGLLTMQQCFWATQITYKFTINLTKTSICLLYLRIFSTEDKARFRRTVYIVMAYVLLYAVASIIATIFECTPVPRIWNKTIPGTCINLTAFWYANAAANMLGDICTYFSEGYLPHWHHCLGPETRYRSNDYGYAPSLNISHNSFFYPSRDMLNPECA